MSAIPPIRREVVVDADPTTAFEVFTSRIGRWWPLAELSVHGTGGIVEFAGGQIVERSADGREAVWGRVTRWEPAAAVAFSWHPGRAPEQASHVEVTFRAAGPQTLVTLSHAGWEVFDDPAAARAEYGHGWPMVLDRYRDQVSQGPHGTAARPGSRSCTSRARQRRRGQACSRTPGSPSTSRSWPACGTRATSSPPGRCPSNRVRA